MAYFPKVDAVNITPMDQVMNNALRNQTLQLENSGMLYANNARNALNDVLKANPNATGQNVLSDMASRGYGEAGQKYAYNWINRQQAALKYESDLRAEVSNVIGSVTDEDSKNQAIDYLQARFPDSDFSQYRAMPWQQAKTLGNNIALGAAGRVKQERVDNTLTANGFTPGQDPGTLHTITTMQKEDDANTRSWNADKRAAELQPYKIQDIQSEINSRGNKTPHIQMVPDPNDPMKGMPEHTSPNIPMRYDSATGQMVPIPIQGQNVTPTPPPAGENRNASYSGGAGKKLDAATAKQYLQKAGGDVEKARAMARADGWSF